MRKKTSFLLSEGTYCDFLTREQRSALLSVLSITLRYIFALSHTGNILTLLGSVFTSIIYCSSYFGTVIALSLLISIITYYGRQKKCRFPKKGVIF